MTGSRHQLNLLSERVALPTPVVGGAKPRKVHGKGRVVLAAGLAPANSRTIISFMITNKPLIHA